MLENFLFDKIHCVITITVLSSVFSSHIIKLHCWQRWRCCCWWWR